MTAEVVVPLPLDQVYTYHVPADIRSRAVPGMRAVVPFRNRRLTGLITAVSTDERSNEKLKSILALPDEQPVFTPELLELTRWIASYYVCGWGEAVRAALPQGTGLTEAQVTIKTERTVRLTSASVDVPLKGPKQRAAYESLQDLARAGNREPMLSEAMAHSGASAAVYRALAEHGLVAFAQREVERSALSGFGLPEAVSEHTLNEGQSSALNEIRSALEASRFQTFLLHGITGSGKTEVYIAALKDALARGKTGIILVPEIALTPQTVRRFRAHFGDLIAVLHSRMSTGERFDAWRHIRSGRYRVVIGPRSAIFAPLDNIGLIVVDEEHETSYKQFDPAPRYHARDVAVVRARNNGAVCILGSATPSLESFANARTGKYRILEMPVRVPLPDGGIALLPEVKVVDLRVEYRSDRMEGVFSYPLREAIRGCLERQEQVILLQNRRGYAPVMSCKACGWSPVCDDCSATMTYHKPHRHLRCHYCGLTRPVPVNCPNCGNAEIDLLGAGTQRIEEELATLFEDARVIRMDLDTTSGKNGHHRLLTRFGRGEADILIGTQMVAKGLDFPRVTLVGVINADAGLLMPDFRSDERTFQLLTQVAGRAGRAGLRGQVILQTRNPAHQSIRFARTHDFLGFADTALHDRKEVGWPPYGRTAVIEFRGESEETLRKWAHHWTELLINDAPAWDVRGPAEPIIARMKRLYRLQTIIRIPRKSDAGALQPVLRRTMQRAGSLPAGCRLAVDVDPVAMT